MKNYNFCKYSTVRYIKYFQLANETFHIQFKNLFKNLSRDFTATALFVCYIQSRFFLICHRILFAHLPVPLTHLSLERNARQANKPQTYSGILADSTRHPRNCTGQVLTIVHRFHSYHLANAQLHHFPINLCKDTLKPKHFSYAIWEVRLGVFGGQGMLPHPHVCTSRSPGSQTQNSQPRQFTN